MKKILGIGLCLLIAFSFSVSAGGRSSQGSTGQGPLVGISVPAASHGWVAAVAYFAEQRAKELGLNYRIVASANPNAQMGHIDDLINMKCHTIVLFPHNNEVEMAAQNILNAGIKLVNFDRKVEVNVTSYLAGDNPGIGVNGAHYIADKLGGRGDVVIMHVPGFGSIDVERVNGFTQTIRANYRNIRILNNYGSQVSSKEEGLKTMTDVLTAHSHIDGVYSMDDELSIGILQAIQDARRSDIKVITGGGGAQEYFNIMNTNRNIWIASALYSPAMIKDAVDVANRLIKGESVQKEIIIPAKIVDRDNVKDYLDAGSPY